MFFYNLQTFFLSLGAKSEWAASLRRARITIRKLCKMQWWFWTVILMVFLNTCTVAVEHYNQPPWLTEFLCKLTLLTLKSEKKLNSLTGAAAAVEMIASSILGSKGYK